MVVQKKQFRREGDGWTYVLSIRVLAGYSSPTRPGNARRDIGRWPRAVDGSQNKHMHREKPGRPWTSERDQRPVA